MDVRRSSRILQPLVYFRNDDVQVNKSDRDLPMDVATDGELLSGAGSLSSLSGPITGARLPANSSAD